MKNNSANIISHVSTFEKMDTKFGHIICGDCLDIMRQLPPDFIVLGFTSPPYLDAINYDQHIEKVKGNIAAWERKSVPYDEYRQFLVARFRELYRLLIPGGFNIVNISPVKTNGERIPLPFHFVGWMEEIGWKFREDIIWEKPIARDRRSGVLMQHPYPGYYYPSLVAEYVLVFQKPAFSKTQENIYWNRTELEKRKNQIDLSDYQGEKSKNVWKIRQLAPQENMHPAPFPLELAKRVIEFYSYKNDWVIDIFAGSGQTNIAAEMLERKHIGMEIRRDYWEYACKRLRIELEKKNSNVGVLV